MRDSFIRSERGPRRSLQPGGGESKDLHLLFGFVVSQVSKSRPGAPNHFGIGKLGLTAFRGIIQVKKYEQ